MGRPGSSSEESGDLLRRDCLRALGFGVDGSPIVVLESPVRFSSEGAEASLFRFETGFGRGNSAKTVRILCN